MKFLELIHSVLKANGWFILGTPNASTLFSGRGRYIDFTHEIGFTPDSLSGILHVSNFKIISIQGEKPVIQDFRSLVRTLLWWIIDRFLKMYLNVAEGTGRKLWKSYRILESRLIVVADKIESSN